MTRRFDDISRPRQAWTWGDTIIVAIFAGFFLLAVLAIFGASLTISHAHDIHRPELNAWFDGLKSGRGLCCSFVDGSALLDADWESKGEGYRVRIEGRWYDVPPDAVLTVPNKYGPAVVWRFRPNETSEWVIRCFIPGAGT